MRSTPTSPPPAPRFLFDPLRMAHGHTDASGVSGAAHLPLARREDTPCGSPACEAVASTAPGAGGMLRGRMQTCRLRAPAVKEGVVQKGTHGAG